MQHDYGDVYSSWLTLSNERDYLEKYLDQEILSWDLPKETSVIDIGCGRGSSASRLYAVLDRLGIKCKYLGIDPSEEQLKRFNEGLVRRGIELRLGTFESLGTEQHFDLAHIIHSLYYAKNIVAVLEKAREIADRILIVHHGERGVNSIHTEFPHYVRFDHRPYEISTHKDIARELDRLGITYKLTEMETQIDIRPFREPQNQHVRNMVKFFLEREDVTEEMVEEIRSWIIGFGDIMPQDIGIFYIESPIQ